MKERGKLEKFKEIFKCKLPKDDRKSAEEAWNNFKTDFVQAAEEFCGGTSTKIKHKETP